MEFCAIICEFNPFHNGHEYLISKAKQLTGLPILCLMSGNFCQRAEPACLSKEIRANHALQAGADVVFELPTIFSTSCAEIFAKGAIHILKSMPVKYLIFGAECGDINLLKSIADYTKTLKNNIQVKEELKTGISYKSALINVANNSLIKCVDILNKPNNILAIEYLKAIENTDITPLVIQREDNYNEIQTKNFCSSKSLRFAAKNNQLNNYINFAPNYVLEDLKNIKDPTLINEHLFFALQTTTTVNLKNRPSISEGLENRIIKIANDSLNFEDFISKAKTKRYSEIRIKRIAIENFLNINKEKINDALVKQPYTILLAKNRNINLDSFFKKPITLILKKSDKKNYQTCENYKINILADQLYKR